MAHLVRYLTFETARHGTFVIVFQIRPCREATATDRSPLRRGAQHRSGRRGWLFEPSERAVTADAVLARAQRADRTRRRDRADEDRFTVLTADRGSRLGGSRCHGMRRSGYIGISAAPTYEGCSAGFDSVSAGTGGFTACRAPISNANARTPVDQRIEERTRPSLSA